MAREMPDIAPLDIMKEVGKIWQRQTENDLKRFRQMAKEDAVRYQTELERFINMLNTLRDLPVGQQDSIERVEECEEDE